MGNIKVGLPAGVAVPGRVAVDRFAVLVSAVGAGVGRLQSCRYSSVVGHDGPT